MGKGGARSLLGRSAMDFDMTVPPPGGPRLSSGLRRRQAQQLFKTDMCKFFMQGRCDGGDKCCYAHDPSELRVKPNLEKTSMCRNMLKAGICNDKRCRFAHGEDELRNTNGFFKMKMCGFVNSGRCKRGSACRFAHSKAEIRPVKQDLVKLGMEPSAPPEAVAPMEMSCNENAPPLALCISARPQDPVQWQKPTPSPRDAENTFGVQVPPPEQIPFRETTSQMTYDPSHMKGLAPFDDDGFLDSPWHSDSDTGPTELPSSEHASAGSSSEAPFPLMDFGKPLPPRKQRRRRPHPDNRTSAPFQFGPQARLSREAARFNAGPPYRERHGSWADQSQVSADAEFSPLTQQYAQADSAQPHPDCFQGQVIPVYAPIVPVAQVPWAGAGEEMPHGFDAEMMQVAQVPWTGSSEETPHGFNGNMMQYVVLMPHHLPSAHQHTPEDVANGNLITYQYQESTESHAATMPAPSVGWGQSWCG